MKDDFRIPLLIREPHAFGMAQMALAERRLQRKSLRQAEKQARKEKNEAMRRVMRGKTNTDNG
ncbi:MAG: hypothetical protein IJ664_07240 [Clostridia bacterium]|nr:hypothetical protein [Clostridia bacterium]